MITTYEHIKISPYKIEYLEKLKITQKINDHARLYLTAVISEPEKDSPVSKTKEKSPIEVQADGAVIFSGEVENIQVRHARGVYYLELEGVSGTMQMDIKRKARSFQDKSEQYQAIVAELTGEYSGDVIDTASKDAATKKFLMQYEETDWEFIKRLASHFNTGLVPSIKTGGVKYFFGLPNGVSRGNLEEYHYSFSKRIVEYLRSQQNTNPSIEHADKKCYTISTEAFFDIGDKVSYQDESLYISEAVYEIKKAVIQNTYRLTTKNGCSQDMLFNDRIIGLSLRGEVLETAKDELKMHLCIDESQDAAKAHFFKYSTMYTASGNSGCRKSATRFLLTSPTNRSGTASRSAESATKKTPATSCPTRTPNICAQKTARS